MAAKGVSDQEEAMAGTVVPFQCSMHEGRWRRGLSLRCRGRLFRRQRRRRLGPFVDCRGEWRGRMSSCLCCWLLWSVERRWDSFGGAGLSCCTLMEVGYWCCIGFEVDCMIGRSADCIDSGLEVFAESKSCLRIETLRSPSIQTWRRVEMLF